MDVHIVIALFGYDPIEYECLGVFEELDDALERKDEIAKRTHAYQKECDEVGGKFIDQLIEWKNKLKNWYNLDRTDWDFWVKIQDYFKYQVEGGIRCAVGSGCRSTIEYFEELKRCVQKLSIKIDFPPLPEIPPPISWQYSHGKYSEYEMDIITKELSGKNAKVS